MSDLIGKYLGTLSEEDSKIHRETFLHFVKQVGAGSEKVSVKCSDGRSFDAVFYTATPFVGKDFRVCVKAALAKVCCIPFRCTPRFTSGSYFLLVSFLTQSLPIHTQTPQSLST